MNIALILSGGIGTRMGVEIPKQYIEVGGRPVISYCMESLFQHYEIDAVQIVADHDWQRWILKWILGEGDGRRNIGGLQEPCRDCRRFALEME